MKIMSEEQATEATSEESQIEPKASEEDEDFRPFEEISESYQPQPIKKVMVDGLPTQVAMGEGSHIPALSTESLVCLEDTRKFVRRYQTTGQISETYEPDQVVQMPNGGWILRAPEGSPWVWVEPIRPRCSHYVEQLTQFELNPENSVLLRLCSGRRTIGGAFMSVSDLAMWACSMRTPRDLISEERLTRFNKQKIEQGESRVGESIFGKGI
jgi:hypothetical protein